MLAALKAEMYNRIVIIGMAGSGKTTLAQQLAQRLALPHIELDALYWDAGWQAAATPVFRARVAAALNKQRWVVDGNYSRVRDLTWNAADTIVWLDYSLPQVYRWLVPRTLRRVITQEPLWNDNREPWAEQLSRNSLLWYVWKQHAQKRRDYTTLFAEKKYDHCERIRLCTPQATRAWLHYVTTTRSTKENAMTHGKSANTFAVFQNQQFMNLITFRRNGQPVTTPVWFAQEGAKLYVFTGGESGKVKRIRSKGAVQIGPSDRRGKPLGPMVNGQARILAGSEAQHADALITTKYGWQKKLITFFGCFRKNASASTLLEITPAPNA